MIKITTLLSVLFGFKNLLKAQPGLEKDGKLQLPAKATICDLAGRMAAQFTM
ncbi:MAG: hypothetical protein ABIO46_10730 [Chitinophagales bacterium]